MRLLIPFARNKFTNLTTRQHKFLCLEQATIANRQGASEDPKFAAKPTQLIPNALNNFLFEQRESCSNRKLFNAFGINVNLFFAIGMIALLLSSFLIGGEFCFFTPPQEWEIAQLKNPSPYIKIGFLGKGSSDFRPSINLAVEEVDVPLKQYVKAVKELQKSDPSLKLRDLGPFSTQAGKGQLLEMSSSSPFGELKILQMIFVQKEKAYILTAAVLKEEFAKLQATILKSLQSLRLTSDLWTPIKDEKIQKKLQASLLLLETSAKKEEEFQKFKAQVESFSELGPYWQFLALQEGNAKISNGGTDP
jgi:hypothetical protein